MVDNVVAIPMEFSSNEGKDQQQIRAKWILLFTNQKNNLRPELQFVQSAMDGFTVLPLEFRVFKGDTLFCDCI